MFNNASFIVIFPLTFIANTFVRDHQPARPLKVVAEWNPVSAVTQAARELFGNTNPAMPAAGRVAAAAPDHRLTGWSAVLLVIFVPFAIRRYKKAVSR